MFPRQMMSCMVKIFNWSALFGYVPPLTYRREWSSQYSRDRSVYKGASSAARIHHTALQLQIHQPMQLVFEI